MSSARYRRVCRETANVLTGTRPKTVLTEAAGHVTIDAPRDRDETFKPQIVKKRQRRLTGVDEVLSPRTSNSRRRVRYGPSSTPD